MTDETRLECTVRCAPVQWIQGGAVGLRLHPLVPGDSQPLDLGEAVDLQPGPVRYMQGGGQKNQRGEVTGSTKPGTCPEDNALCRRHYEAKCQRDEECSGKQKCCFYYCHFDCKYTVEDRLSEVKPGFCPDIQGQCGKKTPSDACTCDGDCRGLYKCCPGACGKQCLRPHSGKLGTCPVVIYQCTKTSPPHKCHRDRDCLGTLKCCPGICGKKCMDALNPGLPKLDKETVEKIIKFKEARQRSSSQLHIAQLPASGA
ncbi:whey acidic protein-like [Vombatus ursinus]|uniref:whey acidic protein-like n=1 Tax=Vombatus ursinus TaxID=29139 RepID=UPI000FFCFD66|nr:whey acidic protein-like [Vombatus ursinus]